MTRQTSAPQGPPTHYIPATHTSHFILRAPRLELPMTPSVIRLYTLRTKSFHAPMIPSSRFIQRLVRAAFVVPALTASPPLDLVGRVRSRFACRRRVISRIGGRRGAGGRGSVPRRRLVSMGL